jgi:hypothetical protein
MMRCYREKEVAEILELDGTYSSTMVTTAQRNEYTKKCVFHDFLGSGAQRSGIEKQ